MRLIFRYVPLLLLLQILSISTTSVYETEVNRDPGYHSWLGYSYLTPAHPHFSYAEISGGETELQSETSFDSLLNSNSSEDSNTLQSSSWLAGTLETGYSLIPSLLELDLPPPLHILS